MTIPDGLRSPEPTDIPDVPSDMQDLADDVQGVLSSLRQQIEDLQDEVAVGWRPIASGEESANFTIDLTAAGTYPAGTFSLIRIYFRGSLSTDGTWLNGRVNSDTTAGMHRRTFGAWRVHDGTNITAAARDGDVTSWPIAWWSSGVACNAQMLIYRTDTSSILGYETTSYRASAGDDVRHKGFGSGHLTQARLLDSLQVFPFSGSINSCWWWAEGFRSV